MRLFFVALVLGWFAFGAQCQLSAQQVKLHWSTDGSLAGFTARGTKNQRTFEVVDVNRRLRRPAFDHAQVAQQLGKALSRKLDSERLPIDRFEFIDANELRLITTAGKVFRWNLEKEQLTESESTRPKSKLFLPPQRSGGSDQRTSIRIENQLDQEIETIWVAGDGRRISYGNVAAGETKPMSTFVGHVWLLQSADGNALACYRSEANGRVVVSKATLAKVDRTPEPRRSRPRRRGSDRSSQSPDGQWQVLIRDHDLWIQDGKEDGEPRLLSDAGEENNTFQGRRGGSPDVRWSPNSKFLVAFQTAPVEVREVHYVESSPKDQLQPKLQSYSYAKPGDPFPQVTLHLFSRDDDDGFSRIDVSAERFADPYDNRFLGWNEAGDAFRMLYNQRGHQVLRLLEIDARAGNVRVLAENSSDTFVQYSDRGKNFHEFVPGERLIWASERSGWNHLYLHDVATGEVLHSITAGNWNVKRVTRVDPETETIWFYAVGVRPDQDPYHEHFCRVNFDGSQLKILTAGDGTHQVSFEQDGKYLLDTWSRVDLAPITELRDAESGEAIAELGREDTRRMFGDRRLPERFVAPGRDGTTDIWGIIHFPRDFDPQRQYPVVEQIYAGPHDHHVPKSFRSRYGCHRIADAGMIVVQIDGMGTAWRSKAFHDVCYKNLKDAGFPDRIAWMKAAAKKFPQLDLSRVGIYGGSAGGQNAMAALLWHHDFYQVAVADCGCHDNRMDKRWWNEQWMGFPIDESYSENSNMENAHLLEGHLMLLVGEADRNVDPASTTQVVDRLIKADKDFEYVLVPGVGHGSASNPWAARKQLNFLKKHLGVASSDD